MRLGRAHRLVRGERLLERAHRLVRGERLKRAHRLVGGVRLERAHRFVCGRAERQRQQWHGRHAPRQPRVHRAGRPVVPDDLERAPALRNRRRDDSAAPPLLALRRPAGPEARARDKVRRVRAVAVCARRLGPRRREAGPVRGAEPGVAASREAVVVYAHGGALGGDDARGEPRAPRVLRVDERADAQAVKRRRKRRVTRAARQR
mmetsp:Transcript_9428/g.32543  ORF Transcript_9428/g.32543 Transcript_9428/m.32543 type:complete len:205 (+) Transcript_9428:59-673(+)